MTETQFFLGFWEHFHFIRPLWLFAIIPGIFTVWRVNRAQVTTDQWNRHVAAHLLPFLMVGSETKKFFRPINVFVLVSLIAVVAMAGPSWQRQISPLAQDSAALAIVLDLSATMEQRDVEPSRVERAKLKIRDILNFRPNGQTAMIVYAGTAHVVTPLTNDPQVVENLVDALGTDMMPEPGKNLGAGLTLADRFLDESLIPGTILIISDGPGSFSSDQMKLFCVESRHSVLFYGFGDPDRSGSHLPPDWSGLSSFAGLCGGEFVAMSHDKSDVQTLVNHVNLNFIASGDEDSKWIDFGYYLLFPLMLLFLLWFRPGWTLKFAIIPFVLLQVQPVEARNWSFLDLWMTPDQQGQYYFEKGEYVRAAKLFEDPEWKATALYMNEDFVGAASLFGLLGTADGYFKLANAFAHDRHYVLAHKAYERCLELNPDYPGAKENQRRLRAIMDEINAVSAAQAEEDGDAKREAGDDTARTAEGAERETMGEFEKQELSAEQILNDPAVNELWMKRVQSDPSKFLKLKFVRQLEADVVKELDQ